MTSSGMKRGLAATAVSALAVTGLPFLTAPANAASVVHANDNAVQLLTQQDEAGTAVGMSTKYDGANSTVHLLAQGGKNIVNVQFSYRDASVVPESWVKIGGPVSRTNGVFTAEWNPAAVLGQPDIIIRVEGLDLNNLVIDRRDTTPLTVGATNVESVDIAKAAGSDLGLFTQPYAGENRTAQLAGLTGTTSSAAGSTVDLDVRAGGTGSGVSAAAVAAEVPAGSAPYSTWKGAVTLNPAYAFTPGGGDQIVVGASNTPGGQTSSDDAEAFAPYAAVVSGITATAKQSQVAIGGTTDVTVKVTDTKGNPVVGAQVVRTGGSEAVAADTQYTDATGEVIYRNVGAGTYSYYVNTTDTNGYDAAVDKKSDNVTISEFVPALSKITATSVDGMAFDRDEYALGDVKIQTKDQAGNARPGEQVYYKWTVKPFAPGSSAIELPEQGPVTTALVGVAPNQRAEANVAVPTNQPSGVYSLVAYTKSIGGVGGYTEAPIEFKVGDGQVRWTQPSPAQTKIGQTLNVTGVLELEDGTALGSIDRADNDPLGDVNRVLSLSYQTGTEQPGPADSKMAPSANQAGPQSLYTIAADGLSGTVRVGEDGKLAVKVMDAVNETKKEKGAALIAGSNNFGFTGNAIDFLESLDPANIAVGNPSFLFGMATPGRPVNVPVTVTNNDNDVLTGVPVKVEVDNGGFLTPAATRANDLQAAEAGGLFGRWKSLGADEDLTTGNNGVLNATVAIERAEGFDDDFANRVGVTFNAGSVTQKLQGGINFVAANALNLSDVAMTVSEETVADLPNVQTRERVFYDVTAKDQFGNLSQENLQLTDEDNARAGFDFNVTTKNGQNPTGQTVSVVDKEQGASFAASGASDTTQKLTATVQGSKTTASATDADLTVPGIQVRSTRSSDNRDLSATLNWYVIDWAKSVFELDKDVADEVAKGTAVTMTASAVDQKGQAIRNLGVQFVRTGPDDNNGTINSGDLTDREGKGTYFFAGSVPGKAIINAAFFEGGVDAFGNPIGKMVGKAAAEQVVFKGGDNGGSTPPPAATNADMEVVNKANGNDLVIVTANEAAKGAKVKLFKVRKNGSKKLLDIKFLNGFGKTRFVVEDRNDRKATKYVAKVAGTSATQADVTPERSTR